MRIFRLQVGHEVVYDAELTNCELSFNHRHFDLTAQVTGPALTKLGRHAGKKLIILFHFDNCSLDHFLVKFSDTQRRLDNENGARMIQTGVVKWEGEGIEMRVELARLLILQRIKPLLFHQMN